MNCHGIVNCYFHPGLARIQGIAGEKHDFDYKKHLMLTLRR
jgi:hypothetical protein